MGQNRLQETPLLNDPQHSLRVRALLELRLLEEFAQPVVVNLIGGDGAGPPHHPHHQPGDVGLQQGQAGDARLNLVGGEAGTELVQPVRRLAEHRLRQRLRQGDHLLPDHAALEHQHQEDQPPLGGDELHVPVAGLGGLGRGDQRRAASGARQHRRRQRHPLLYVVPHLLELMGDGAALRHRQLRLPQQPLHEIPVALHGGLPPGRGVGMGQVSQFLQPGHLVAHRGRADVQPVLLHQRPRTDRRPGLDELPDDQFQNHLLTGSEFVHFATTDDTDCTDSIDGMDFTVGFQLHRRGAEDAETLTQMFLNL